MEPPAAQQQSTSTAPGGTQGTRKLRESCISCSRSKVKCNKEKPTGSRCVRRGLPCEYMVSRRTGRTRVIGVEQQPTTAPPTTSTSTSTIATAPATATKAGPPAGTDSAVRTPAITTAASPKPVAVQSPPTESELWGALLSPNASSSTDLSSLLSVNPDFGQLLASLSPSFLDGVDGMDGGMNAPELSALSAADPSSSIMQGLEGRGTIQPPSSNSTSPPCCLAICLDILMRLFPNAGVGCERPGHEGGPGRLFTIESVIEDNKQILDTVQTVLDCRCAEDEYVVTLVSLVVLKALGWYVAVARDRSSDAGREDDFNNWVTAQDGRRRYSVSSSFEEQVLHLPTVIGSYCVDGHHQSRMAAQLVLSELYRVQRLVTQVSRRLESVRRRSSSSSSSTSTSTSSLGPDSEGGLATPLSSTTLAHLEDDLRKRLRAVSSETIGILRRA
ncbi:Sterigmatocystin biosynthesis regulatory protein [Aspergillus egyptiacus]|nr:Sterigmatocystin biosynthesis regulatory protein [Aspergillus egyptiacus]